MIVSDHVLGIDAGGQPAGDADATHLQRLQGQALRREHVAHLRGADAECDRAERAVRGGVAVAAGDRHARLRQPELGTDHVHDALAVVIETGEANPEVAAVALERRHHVLGHQVDERPRPLPRRHDVVGRGKRPIGPRHLPAAQPQRIECLRCA